MTRAYPHPTPATETEAPTRALLCGQLVRLNHVIANGTFPEMVCMAKRYAARVSRALEQADVGLADNAGFYGDNGWGPAIDSICRNALAPITLADVAERRAA
jgi:hypothetical protein